MRARRAIRNALGALVLLLAIGVAGYMLIKIEELQVPPGGVGVDGSLRDVALREQGLIVIAVKKVNGEMLFNPDADVHVDAGDRLVVMGQALSLRDLERRLTS